MTFRGRPHTPESRRRIALGVRAARAGRPGEYTPEEDAVILSGLSLGEAARRLGRSRSSVSGRRRLLRTRG